MDIFYIHICCKICKVFEKTKINEKEAGVAHFCKKTVAAHTKALTKATFSAIKWLVESFHHFVALKWIQLTLFCVWNRTRLAAKKFGNFFCDKSWAFWLQAQQQQQLQRNGANAMEHKPWDCFFKKGQPRPLFVYFQSFQSNIIQFFNKLMWKTSI